MNRMMEKPQSPALRNMFSVAQPQHEPVHASRVLHDAEAGLRRPLREAKVGHRRRNNVKGRTALGGRQKRQNLLAFGKVSGPPMAEEQRDGARLAALLVNKVDFEFAEFVHVDLGGELRHGV